MFDYILVQGTKKYEEATTLFKLYAEWLNIDLGFQKFDQELQSLEKMYAKPHGGIILCKNEKEYLGCIAIRKIEPGTAELKRMYVKPGYQNRGIGACLLEEALLLAKRYGYQKIRLDTLNHMIPAINLYKKNGFYEIPAYYYNPESTAIYFEKTL